MRKLRALQATALALMLTLANVAAALADGGNGY